MLFSKKKPKELPLEEVRKMAAKGMSDKDIIKELKHQGYSYDEIEKSMLQAVKEGVDEPKQDFEFASQQEEFAPPTQQQLGFELPTLQEETPELDVEQSDALLEELIEGVIDEKWQKFEDRIAKVEETFDRIKAEIKQFETRLAEERNQSPMRDLEIKINDIAEHLDDMDARVGGLEKAFKQFLPSLTRNIESLSQLIHEIKEKTGHELEEEV